MSEIVAAIADAMDDQRVARTRGKTKERTLALRRRLLTKPVGGHLESLLRAMTGDEPCRRYDSKDWIAASPEVREAAAWRCQDCHVKELCAVAGAAQSPRVGVWGGHDFTAVPNPRWAR